MGVTRLSAFLCRFVAMKIAIKEPQLKRIFNSFNNLHALVIGDVMLDAYVFGKVSRISPEAPVPVVEVETENICLGGAANVAGNLVALGAKVTIATAIGDDKEALQMITLLKKSKISPEGIIKSKKRVTTVKTRVIGNNHQLIRFDKEQVDEISSGEQEKLIATVISIIQKRKIDVVVFEDYDKGSITKSLIDSVIKECNTRKIPVAVDPKKRHFFSYSKADLFKPNLKELKEGLKTDIDSNDIKQLMILLNKALVNLEVKSLFATLSEKGVVICDEKETVALPAHVRTIADVSGAGDTVISVAALCLALKLDNTLLAELSNIAGGLVCEQVGVVPINKEQFFSESKKALCN